MTTRGLVLGLLTACMTCGMGCAARATTEDPGDPIERTGRDVDSDDAADTSNTVPAPAPAPTQQQTPAAPTPQAPPAGPLKAFVTSATYKGTDLGGIAGADAICNDLAKAASLPGNYRAWISAGNTNAIDRMTASGPWERVDGQIVANTKADLAKGSLTLSLDRDEKGQTPAAAEDRVWTATGSNGKKAGGDCNAWTGAGTGRVGEAEQKSVRWTSLVDEACGEVNRLYCFQQ